jgi:uncharacterized membrane protein YkoI
MKRRIAIAAALAALALGALSGGAVARDCGAPCAQLVQQRVNDADSERRVRPPYLRSPGGDTYGGRMSDRPRALPPGTPGGEALSDSQIWSIAKARVPGRIVNARLQGSVYSFRIISNRGSIVDVVVDRYSGRIVSVRGGP